MALNVANGERRLKVAAVDFELVEKGCHATRSNEKELSRGERESEWLRVEGF
jgi:hypothetical protein